LDELAEDELQWENVNQRYESMEDEKDYDKEMLLKKLEEINQSQKPPIEYFKGVNDVHIGFRCLVEDLNNQIFKCYQDRILLEDYQTEFNQRITALRKEIKV
jgi:predicted DNA-binding ArsR family transcriptional regulator